MLTTRHKVSWGGAAIAVLLLQGYWLDWRWSQREAALRTELQDLQAAIGAAQGRALATTPPATEAPSASDERMQRAVKRLDSKNLVERYQAGMTLREYGERAVPELLALVRTGSGSTRQAALLILADIRSPKAAADLRTLAGGALSCNAVAQTGTSRDASTPLDTKTLAAVLGILARTQDEMSLPLLRQALKHPDERVRAAAVVGLREFDAATDVLPELVARLGKEKDMTQGELEKTILRLCHQAPDAFAAKLTAVPPESRFSITTLLAKDASATATAVLRQLTRDRDQRVALSAAAMLARRGDSAGRLLAEQVAGGSVSPDLRAIAADILKSLDREKKPQAP